MGRKGKKSKETLAREQKERMRKRRQEKKDQAIVSQTENVKVENAKLEKAKVDKEKTKVERVKVDKVKTEHEIVEEVKVKKEKVENEKVEKEKAKVEKEKIEKVKAEHEKVEKVRKEKIENEKVEKEKANIKKEKVEQEKTKVEKEKAKVEKEQVKAEHEKVEKVKVMKEKAKVENEKIEKVKAEHEKVEKVGKQKIENKKVEKEKANIKKEKVEQEKTKVEKEKAKIEKEKVKAEQKKIEKENVYKVKVEKTKVEKAKVREVFEEIKEDFKEIKEVFKESKDVFKEKSKEVFEEESKEVFEKESKELFEKESKEVFEEERKEVFEEESKEVFEKESKEVFEKKSKDVFKEESKEVFEEESKEVFEKESNEVFEKENKVVFNFEHHKEVYEQSKDDFGIKEIESEVDCGNFYSEVEHDSSNYDPFLSIKGSFHQGDALRFGSNAGKQCVANCFVAIVCSKIKPLAEWTTEYLDSILSNGNELYTHIHGNNDLLLVDEIPGSIEVFNYHVQCTKRESINAILGEVDLSFPMGLSLDLALQTALMDSDGCFICVNGFTSLAIKQNGHLYLFDSHSRDLNGRSDAFGSSIAIHLDSINHLYDILRAFVNNNRNSLFEITGVEVNILSNTTINSVETDTEFCSIEQTEHVHTTQDMESRPRESFDNSQTIQCDVQTGYITHGSDSDIEMLDNDETGHAYDFKPLDYKTKTKLCRIMNIPTKHAKSASSESIVYKMGTPDKTKTITADGNCLFRAISYALCQRQEFHEKVRKAIVNYLLTNKSLFQSFLQPQFKSVEEHVNSLGMLNNKVWGTALEIIAAADLLKTDIYTFFNGSWIRYSPSQVCSSYMASDKSIYLKHHGDINHYEVVLSVNKTTHEELFRTNECLKRCQNDTFLEIPVKKRHIEGFNTNKEKVILRSKQMIPKKDKDKIRYYSNPDFRNAKLSQVKLRSRVRYENDEEYRKSLKRKHDSATYREKTRSHEKEKYETNEEFRHKKRSISQEKYICNEDHREHKKNSSRDRYANNEEHKDAVKLASKEKYANNKEHQEAVKLASKEKYANNEEHKRIAKQISKQKYAENEAHREKIKEQTISRRQFEAEKTKCIDTVVDKFKKKVQDGPDHICSCCFKLFFESQVIECKKETYVNKGVNTKSIYETCVSEKYLHKCSEECEKNCPVLHTSRGSLWICYTCHRKILKGEKPHESFSNNLLLEEVPDQLSCLNSLEQHLIALSIPFIKIMALPKGGQKGVHGPVVCVPSDLKKITTQLPRSEDDNLLFRVKLKRKLEYKGYEEYKFVSSKHLKDAWYLLKDINKWFVAIDIDDEQLCDTEISNDNCEEINQSRHDFDQLNNPSEDKSDEKQGKEGQEPDIELEDDSFLDDGLRGVQLDTCLQPADIGQEALDLYFDKIYNISPAEGNKPVSVLQEEGLEAKTFPVHYPSGKNTFDEERENKLSLLSYFKLRLMSVENRFARDTSYLFFCQYLSELDRVISNVQISMRKDSQFSTNGEKITSRMLCDTDKLKTLFKNDEAIKFMKPIRGTPPYWQSTQKDIFAMIRQLGIPTFFCSFSSADFRWTEIVDTILKQQGDKRRGADLDWKGKCEVLCSNPVTVARMFEHRFQSFLKDVVLSKAQPIGKIIDYFYRVEFQQRGSPHTHCLFWVEDAPKFGEDLDEDVVDFVDKYITCKIPDKENESELHDIVTTVQQHSRNHSKSCRKKGTVCRFNFPRPPSERTFILRTNNVDEDDEQIHSNEPCKDKIALLWDEIKKGEQTNTMELFKKVGITQEEFEKILATAAKRNSVELKRQPNEIYSNQYNPHLLRAWNANIDIQYVLDAYSCVVYIISYISKSERELGLLLQQTKVEAAEGNLDAQHTMKKIGTAYLHHREISAQEAVFRVTGLKLKESSRKVQFIPVGENPCRMTKPLKDIDRIQKSSKAKKSANKNDEEVESEESIWMTSIVDRYKERPNLELFQTMCLASFCSEYNVLAESQVPKKINKDTTFKLKKDMGYIRKRTRTAHAVIRYPRFSIETAPENYYQSILQLFLPYRREEQLKPPQFESYENFYFSGFVKFGENDAPMSVRNVVDENMSQFVKDEKTILEAERHLYEHGEPEDAWAQLCPESEVERRECIEEGSKSTVIEDEMATSSIPDLNNLKATDIKTTNLLENKFSKNEILPLLRSLNNTQRLIFYHVRDWCIKKANGSNPDPFYVLVTGGGGTGKSHLIKCLYFEATRILAKASENPDDLTVLLTAPTGTAAFNINGMTIHSALGIYKSLSADHASLGEDKINTLRSKMESLQILIIDEISMVNKRLLFFIHERLRQMKKTREDCPFGGVSVIAVGDFYQLPPVKTKKVDKLYINDPSSAMNHLWHDLFTVVELKEVMRQKGDGEFAKLLNRLRERKKGELMLQEDLISLKECIREGPKEVLHIFPTNNEVQSFNNDMVMKMCADTQIIEAEDFEKNKTTGKLLRKKCHFQNTDTRLPQSILLGTGARVMLIRNEDIKDGLVNGVMGTVMCISESHQKSLPSFIYIHFDNEKVGKNYEFQKVIAEKRCVGLQPSSEDVPLRNGTRKQFPLQLAWACTVHKVQGLTVKECVVDLNKCFSCGQAYVALSRVTTKQGLYISDIDDKKLGDKIYCDADVMEGIKSMESFLSEKKNFLNNTQNYLKIMYHNIQGLNAHIKDLQINPEFNDADYICLTETWLEKDSEIKNIENYRLKHISRFDSFESTETDYQALKGQQHGGVGVLYKFSRSFGEVSTAIKNLECIMFAIPEYGITVITVYRTQKYPVRKFIENFQVVLKSVCQMSNKIIVIGDFNQDISKGEMSCFNLMVENGFQQYVKEATTEGGTLIDHVYVKGQINPIVTIVPTYYSYHEAISVVFEIL